MTISIAKQPTKRTAKGLILSGADGHHARRDGRRLPQWDDYDMRPILDTRELITESLEVEPFITTPMPETQSSSISPLHRRRTRVRRPVHTVESPGYAYRPVLSTAGRSVVYISGDDAWNLRVRR